MKYYEIKEFLKLSNISRTKLFRFYAANPKIKKQVKSRGKKNLYPDLHLKYFESKVMFEENIELNKLNKCYTNLIDNLRNLGHLGTRLWYLDWDGFYTVSYKFDRNQKSCYKNISDLYNKLIEDYGKATNIRLFFVIEKNLDVTLNHVHFYLSVEKEYLRPAIRNDIEHYFNFDRLHYQGYDYRKAGLFYVCKQGLSGENYDLFGSNLKKEGLDYEKNKTYQRAV